MIIPIGFRLATFSTSGLTTAPALLEDGFIVWTQIELYYSIVSATIFCIRALITNLTTHYGALPPDATGIYAFGNESRKGSSGTYMLSQLRSTFETRSDRLNKDQIRTVPTIAEQDKTYVGDAYCASANVKSDVVGSINPETNSIGSDDSKRLIIRKHVSWTVEHE